jgi:predicted acyltransferase
MAGQNTRLISLDVFRGMTIAGMVLVNNPGTSPVYWPLDHAEWNGLTPTDWIFPFFLFIVGVAIPIALGRRVEQGITSRTYTKIISRSVSIYLLGLAISVVPFFNFGESNAPDTLKLLVWLAMAAALLFLLLRNYKIAGILAGVAAIGLLTIYLAGYTVVPYNFGNMRIMGVLQRIAVCYLAASLIFLHTNWKQQIYIAGALLIGYWLLMTMVPVPGCDVTTMNDKACNLAAYIDRMILTEPHMWRVSKVYDPEGLLSTIPAIVTCLSGVLTGTWLVGTRASLPATSQSDVTNSIDNRLNKVSAIFFFGIVLFALGWIWNSFFPFNKSLWTSSYVLVTSGLALLTFGFCYWLIDIKGYRRWAWPFVVFGANALALFVFSGIFARMMSAFKVSYTAEGRGISVQKWIVDNIYLAVFQPINASLAYAISFILLWLFFMWLLYRRNIYLKV